VPKRVRTQQKRRQAPALGELQEAAEGVRQQWGKEKRVQVPVVGTLRSCFNTRNGTPRQPGLVTAARAELKLDTDTTPPGTLQGLQEFSHAWVVYLFHHNTDLRQKLPAQIAI
jgi:hypothetical protein